MRRAANVDNTHREAVRQLRQIGASVQPLHTVGNGCPDLIVGWRGVNVLVEMKDGAKNQAKRALNVDQQKWHSRWAGQVCVAESAEEAVVKVIAVWQEAQR
jgi:Holliday junction resolvase